MTKNKVKSDLWDTLYSVSGWMCQVCDFVICCYLHPCIGSAAARAERGQRAAAAGAGGQRDRGGQGGEHRAALGAAGHSGHNRGGYIPRLSGF